jgi:hypothetical protein
MCSTRFCASLPITAKLLAPPTALRPADFHHLLHIRASFTLKQEVVRLLQSAQSCSWGLLFTDDRGFCHRPLRISAALSCESQLPKVDTRGRAQFPVPSFIQKLLPYAADRATNARYTPAHTAKTQRLQLWYVGNPVQTARRTLRWFPLRAL